MRTALLALTFLSSSAHALEGELLNALESVGGIYSSIYLHEIGYALVFKAFGASGVSIQVPRKDTIFSGETSAQSPVPFSPGQGPLIAASGLLVASLAGELVLQQRGLHRSAYAQAVLGTAVVSNFRHAYTYYTRLRGKEGYTDQTSIPLNWRDQSTPLLWRARRLLNLGTSAREAGEHSPLLCQPSLLTAC